MTLHQIVNRCSVRRYCVRVVAACAALTSLALGAAFGGMVSHWPFDSDLSDSQFNYDGAPAGDAAVDTAIKRVGAGALKLDGVGDYVNVGDLDVTTASLSISAWVRLGGLDNTDCIFTTIESPYVFGVRDSGCIWAGINGDDWYATDDDGAVVPLDTWTHLAMIYDGTNIVRYINGEATGTDKPASGNIVASTEDEAFAVIGSDGVGNGRDLDGHVDDLAVWDHALTTQQLARVVEGGALNWRGSGLISYWPFDTETVFADQQGHYDGEVRGDAHVDGDDKVYGTGSLDLDGAEGPGDEAPDCVKIFHAYVVGDAMTLAAWVKLTGEPDEDEGVITKRNSLGHAYVLGIRDSGHVWAGVGTGGGGLASTADLDGGEVPLNTWTHIAMVYDGAEVVRYLNGTETGTRLSVSGNINNVFASAFVGCDSGIAEGWLQGRIDDAALWNEALTAGQIRNAMQLGPPEWDAARDGTIVILR